MKTLLILSAMFISMFTLTTLSASGLSKDAATLNALGSAWKSYSSVQPKQNPNDITIVYGGADVSHRPGMDTATIVT